MARSEIIIDTSALIAFLVSSETHHQTAKNYILKHPDQKWIILETVFNETVTWIRTRISSQSSVEVGQVLRTEHRYVHISDQDEKEIWKVFCKYDDKKWSYTDCSLLVMAHRLEVFEVFTFDKHIYQMSGLGIICVP